MRISLYILILFFLELLFSNSLWAQSSSTFGSLPTLQIDADFKNRGSLLVSYQQRNDVFRSSDKSTSYRFVLSDLTAIYSQKITDQITLSAGGLFRYRNNELIGRTLQQIGFEKQSGQLKLANRVRLDQTYFAAGVEHRLRYRFGIQIPLKTISDEQTKLYFKASNEYLGSYFENKSDLEIRVASSLGIALDNATKLELGLDYRLAQLISTPQKHAFWLTLGIYFKI